MGDRGWHIWEGCAIPLPDFYLVVLYSSSGCREERSWQGKKSNRVWERTETRVENLVGRGLTEILCLDRQSCPFSEMLMKTSWQASGEALRLHRGAVASAALEFVKHMLEKEQSGLG